MAGFSVQGSMFRVLVLVLVRVRVRVRGLVLVLGSALIMAAARASTIAIEQNVDWPLHNLDLAGSRFSPLDQIDTRNVASLAPRWLFQHGVIDGVSNQTTPVVVGGMMYVTDSRGSVYALDAADGQLVWTYAVTE